MLLWKKIFLAFVIVILLCVAYGWYLYTKAPAYVSNQPPYRELTAEELADAFEADEAAANREYTDKVLIVSGVVARTEIDATGQATVFLKTSDPFHSVTCSFYKEESASVKRVTAGKKVRIKGKCTGMLTDVILNKCSMVD